MSERISLKIEAPEWRPVIEDDLNKIYLSLVVLPKLAREYISRHLAYLDATHRMGWRPDDVTVSEKMRVQRHKLSWARDNDSFLQALMMLKRCKANADAWRKRNGKPVRELV